MRYADDFVLMGRTISEKLKDKVREIIEIMGLEINEEKTKVVNAEVESFDFLGFTFRYDNCLYTKGKKYWNVIPSEKSKKRVRTNISECLKQVGHFSPVDIVIRLNPKLRGWFNYFSIPGVSYPSETKRDIEWYLKERLVRYYKRKSQRKSKLYRKGAFEYLVEIYGLIQPTTL